MAMNGPPVLDGGPHSEVDVRLAAHSPSVRGGMAALLAGHVHLVEGEAQVALLDEAALPEWLDDAPHTEAPVVLSDGPPWLAELTELGSGWAWLPLDAGAHELLLGILSAAAGLVVLSPAQAGNLAQESEGGGVPAGPLPGSVPTLTPREREVLALLALGLSNKRAARELGVSDHTVKFHVQALYSKLGVSSRAAAVTRGLQLGLLSV